mmetsp:Transcript_21051/g.42319  ORF Transcript_21051/g.42319 Transcript_21051/m.42319 type:complete len:215 (-) Transcript_21051:93-737(-)|eukprot:CAMPEP_0170237024 /NCGR_PEP_ID=MMETSP0116_2-20130129/18261_1 /TAXON_ID=400756 /ORGANISM="Durinskia baltica, Strain CSIRO CS-38" /LENGTH=214 /DNA_ID=CAMNT_0010487825 /DNA_START=118 /DNA_END=762 /DNA_ORIENTATION=-
MFVEGCFDNFRGSHEAFSPKAGEPAYVSPVSTPPCSPPAPGGLQPFTPEEMWQRRLPMMVEPLDCDFLSLGSAPCQELGSASILEGLVASAATSFMRPPENPNCGAIATDLHDCEGSGGAKLFIRWGPSPTPHAAPSFGSAELPSQGSLGHAEGRCKPCSFLHTKGCQGGFACKFCHICGPDERRQRRKEKRDSIAQARATRMERRAARLGADA